jgi:hypothetical protein
LKIDLSHTARDTSPSRRMLRYAPP